MQPWLWSYQFYNNLFLSALIHFRAPICCCKVYRFFSYVSAHWAKYAKNVSLNLKKTSREVPRKLNIFHIFCWKCKLRMTRFYPFLPTVRWQKSNCCPSRCGSVVLSLAGSSFWVKLNLQLASGPELFWMSPWVKMTDQWEVCPTSR